MLRFLRTGNKRTKTIWWVLIIVTVVTFLGGFVFILGSGLDATRTARATGAVATVNGESVIADASTRTRSTSSARPTAASTATIPPSATRRCSRCRRGARSSLQRILGRPGQALGLVAHDREVVLVAADRTRRPLLAQPAFQTDGKFDPAKYQAAMRDPNNNWAPFEELVREQLPVRKLQERLLTSIKVARAELREAFRDRFERVDATVAAGAAGRRRPRCRSPPTPTCSASTRSTRDASRPARATQLEVLGVPKKFGEEEVRAARQDLAQSLVERARRGEDFAALARDYSEGPGAEQGGVVDRSVLTPAEFGAELAPKDRRDGHGRGDATRCQDGGRFMIVQGPREACRSPRRDGPACASRRSSSRSGAARTQLRTQFDELEKLRRGRRRDGLGKAATAAGPVDHAHRVLRRHEHTAVALRRAGGRRLGYRGQRERGEPGLRGSRRVRRRPGLPPEAGGPVPMRPHAGPRASDRRDRRAGREVEAEGGRDRAGARRGPVARAGRGRAGSDRRSASTASTARSRTRASSGAPETGGRALRRAAGSGRGPGARPQRVVLRPGRGTPAAGHGAVRADEGAGLEGDRWTPASGPSSTTSWRGCGGRPRSRTCAATWVSSGASSSRPPRSSRPRGWLFRASPPVGPGGGGRPDGTDRRPVISALLDRRFCGGLVSSSDFISSVISLLRLAELPHGLTDAPRHLGHLAGPEDQQDDDEQDHRSRPTESEHVVLLARSALTVQAEPAAVAPEHHRDVGLIRAPGLPDHRRATEIARDRRAAAGSSRRATTSVAK